MGVDLTYQSLPPECDFLDLFPKDDELGWLVEKVPRWIRQEERNFQWLQPWPAANRLCRWLDDLVEQYPGIEYRYWEFESRSWDKLHFLLSANRRGEPTTDRDLLLDAAVVGAFEVGGQVRGTQGHPTRYTPASQVARAAEVLESITIETLKEHYIPEKIDAANVRGFNPLDLEDDWKGTVCDFDCFRAFYFEAAEHNEFVIAVFS